MVNAIERAEAAEAQFREGMQEQNLIAMMKEKLPTELAPFAAVIVKQAINQNPDEYERYKESLIQNALNELDALTPLLTDHIFEKLSSMLGILSLSEVPDQMPMWAHYASEGRGFLIKFDSTNTWFHMMKTANDEFRQLRRVQYVDVCAPKALTELSGTDVLYTKGSAWSYEREWRIIRPFTEETENIGTDIHLFAFPPEVIAGVIVGFNSVSDTVTAIKAACNADCLQHVLIQRAELNRSTSGLSFVIV